MAVKLSPILTKARIQIFSEAIVHGDSQSDAYRTMHPVSKRWKDRTVHTKASLWAKSGEVQGKVADLRKEASKRNETSVDLLDKMHKAAFKKADKMDNPSAMTSSAKNLGDLHGLNKNLQKIVTDDGNGGESAIGVTIKNHFHEKKPDN